MISCEWIQIPQSTNSPHAITLNTSLLLKNAQIHVLDHSEYNGFFSYINPNQDHVKVNENIVNIHYKNESNRNDNTTDAKTFSEVYASMKDEENEENNRKLLQKGSRIVFLKSFKLNEIINFFKNMEHSFAISTFEGIQYKTTVLKTVQNDILIDIGLLEKENVLFSNSDINHFITGRRLKLSVPTALEQNNYRIKRSPSSHEMDFPSAETALMTISFLTLAVFLIKLVLVRKVSSISNIFENIQLPFFFCFSTYISSKLYTQ